MVAPKLQTIYLRFLRALDAFAENRIRNAVSGCEQRRAARETNRYRRMMNANRKRPAKTVLEARQARTTLEAELFRGRYHLSSKNDDDLPIVR